MMHDHVNGIGKPKKSRPTAYNCARGIDQGRHRVGPWKKTGWLVLLPDQYRLPKLGREWRRRTATTTNLRWFFWYYQSWCWGDKMKKEWAISHNNTNLKSCHNFQRNQASSPVSRNYVYLNLSPIPCEKGNCIGKNRSYWYRYQDCWFTWSSIGGIHWNKSGAKQRDFLVI